MSVRVAINGFGRIGRLVFRAAVQNNVSDLEFVAINDITDTRTLAHLLKYDSIHRRFPGTVEYTDNELIVNGKSIKVFAIKDPAQLPWKDLGIDIVIESTGLFTKKADAEKHIQAGAKKVIITAPADGVEKTDIIGPLGNGFNVDGDFNTALIVAGGLGIAPFPFLTKILKEKGKNIISFVGARTKSQLVLDGLVNVNIATDDGSYGYRGTVVELFKSNINDNYSTSKVFGCGPTPMLKALIDLCDKLNLDCEVSVETPMACGTGLCQGCAVKTKDERYKLACKDGPIFNSKDILL